MCVLYMLHALHICNRVVSEQVLAAGWMSELYMSHALHIRNKVIGEKKT